MLKLIYLFLFLLSATNCMAQADKTKDKMRLALIYGHGPSSVEVLEALKVSRAQPQFAYDPKGYGSYAWMVVHYAYKNLYKLDKTQRKYLLKDVMDAYKPEGVKPCDVHEIIGISLKDMITYNQYVAWTKLDVYPEYEYYR